MTSLRCWAATLAGAGLLFASTTVTAQSTQADSGAAGVASPNSAARAFEQLLDEHWRWWLRNHPVQATGLGVRDYDDQLDDPSLQASAREAREAKGFLQRLDRIVVAELSPADRINHGVLRRTLSNRVEGEGFAQRAQLFSNRRGWHLSTAQLHELLPLFTKRDYESYLARLARYPEFNQAAITTTREAIRTGAVHPCAAMSGFDASILVYARGDPEGSSFFEPFRTKPSAISDADWAALRTRALQLITTQIQPEYRRFHEFYTSEYAPKCRQRVGAAAMPGGREWYAYRVRVMTTTDMTPDQIHRLGLSEVARIRAEMDEAVRRSGFKGDRAAYVEHLRTDPQYYPKNGEQLLNVATFLAKRIDGEMPKLFGRLPRLPYTVKAVPQAVAAGTTTAYYERGAPEAGRAGVYRVNLSKLDQRPLFEMPALTVHEAVPGHHHQIALQQELDLPPFRRHAASFTAFSEGWGLYSERLGIEMGLYDTPEKDFGRLSYEMWRATRLVVDTGLHDKGWTREQAIQFMLENTALSRGNIEAEVNRYIVDAGQALAYKIGELKIRELRTKAERELGPRFDLRTFHDAVLENGAVPLDVLETHVNGWIARQKITE
ncbi:MAG: DUF885 domain-containing protein [Proteobacteria bacterium]|nr:DUF885 domain-containing protein [Pseudomonadota bacterium]